MKKHKLIFSGMLDPALKEIFKAEALPDVEVTFIDRGVPLEAVTEKLKNADFLVVHKSTISPFNLLEKAEKLKFLQTLSIGTTHIPVQQATERGIPVSYAGNVTARSVAEHTILLIMATLKRFMAANDIARHGKTNADWNVKYIRRVEGKIVGIMGFGNIGQAVAKMVCGLGAHVLYFDIRDIPESVTAPLQAKRMNLNELLSNADIVTLHLSLTRDTERIIGWDQLNMMKPSAILVNTGRGALIDEAELIRALKEKKIAGAGLDVFEKEPLDLDNPLLHMDNVVITPHIASEVWEDYILLIKLVWKNISLILDGKDPHNLVIPPKSLM
jgi:phosphoglycerate dehydrogenase-like enzyme